MCFVAVVSKNTTLSPQRGLALESTWKNPHHEGHSSHEDSGSRYGDSNPLCRRRFPANMDDVLDPTDRVRIVICLPLILRFSEDHPSESLEYRVENGLSDTSLPYEIDITSRNDSEDIEITCGFPRPSFETVCVAVMDETTPVHIFTVCRDISLRHIDITRVAGRTCCSKLRNGIKRKSGDVRKSGSRRVGVTEPNEKMNSGDDRAG